MKIPHALLGMGSVALAAVALPKAIRIFRKGKNEALKKKKKSQSKKNPGVAKVL